MYYTNGIIILLSGFAFGINKIMYALILLYIEGYIADRVILGISDSKAFYIITKKPNDIKEYIVNNLKHTVTIVNAKGGYSNKKKKMIMCVIPTIEYGKVKEVIKEIDREAFFLITDSYYVSK